MKIVVFLILFLNSVYGFSKELLVGVVISPPFSEEEKSGSHTYFYGFGIDIMNDICMQLKIQCVFKALTFSNQFNVLEQGKVDVLLLASPYQPSHVSNYAISLPYIISKIQFAATKDSSIQMGDDINYFKIGTLKHTFYELLIHSPYKKNNTIIPFDTVADLMLALSDHTVDIVALNNAFASHHIYNNTYEIKAVSDEMLIGDGYGIIALPSKGNIIKEIDQAILTMQTNGSYIKIYNKYHHGM